MNDKSIMPTLDQLSKLIAEQFPEYSHLPITHVEKQGHDNRTYGLASICSFVCQQPQITL
jgi:hypothetical protein